MPITADRMQSIIELAVEALKITDLARRTLFNIKDDILTLKIADEEQKQELISQIIFQIDNGIKFDILESQRQELYQERAHFEINFRKNKKRREIKRIQRRIHPEDKLENDRAIKRALQNPTYVEQPISNFLEEPQPEPEAKSPPLSLPLTTNPEDIEDESYHVRPVFKKERSK